MLEVADLDVFYGDLQALWGVSLHVDRGEIIALVGSNGAGKSTLLKTLSGLIKPKRGSATYNGTRLDLIKQHEIVQKGVSMVPEGRRVFSDMTVVENLELGAYLGRARRLKDETLEWMFATFPVLRARRHQLAGTLSGGEQQMLAIARGLMSHPDLLLLDEASLGLAPIIVKTIYQTIRTIITSRGITVLLVEQNVRYALQTAKRAYVIENGRIVLSGESKDLLDSEQVKSAYLAVG
ncbi:MAG: ABC transporter ATP-binding protein [Pseudomonadota bacterium]